MSINNLHSLIGGKWFIQESYGQALLLSLYTILQGKNLDFKKGNQKQEEYIFSKTTGVTSAVDYNSNKSKDEYVAILNFKNPIYKYNQVCGPQGTKTKQAILERYKQDSNCIGVVLDIDSGGGQVSGTPEFHDYIKNYSKPNVTYTDEQMCSAAYYIGSGSNHIIANKRATYIGSIGALIHFIDMTGAYEKIGAKVITEYATKSTKKNKDFEDLLKGDAKSYIKNQLDPCVDTFIADMKAVRPLIDEKVFAGGTWNAENALKLGLIDEIGTLQTAIDKVIALSKQSNTNNNMSKQHPKLEAVLGLAAPLASTEGKGSYLNEEQLDQIESNILELQESNSSLKTEANTELKEKLTALESEKASFETSVTTILDSIGLEALGTITEKIKALASHVSEIGKKDGAMNTIVKTDLTPGTTVTYLDANASHNQMADAVFK